MFADGHPPPVWYCVGYQSLRRTLLEAVRTQGIRATYEALPNQHPIDHCYFDFDSGPPTGADYIQSFYPGMDLIDHIDGLTVDGRLVGILSEKGYYIWSWTEPDPRRLLQFGINTIIFALTQEGSITHRLMDSIR